MLVLPNFPHLSAECTETGSANITQSRVWIGNFNVKAWKTTKHKLHKIWRSLSFCTKSRKQAHPWRGDLDTSDARLPFQSNIFFNYMQFLWENDQNNKLADLPLGLAPLPPPLGNPWSATSLTLSQWWRTLNRQKVLSIKVSINRAFYKLFAIQECKYCQLNSNFVIRKELGQWSLEPAKHSLTSNCTFINITCCIQMKETANIWEYRDGNYANFVHFWKTRSRSKVPLTKTAMLKILVNEASNMNSKSSQLAHLWV